MTERFNANAEGTTLGTSGIGPSSLGSNLVTLGLGQGSGQTANNQENNYFAQFEYPIKWADVANALEQLGDKKKLDELLDDMTTRDQVLEDYLNTNVVNGIVAGSRITIDRAAGVVTITATDQRPGSWITFTPSLLASGTPATITNNNSAYIVDGSVVHVRVNFSATYGVATFPTTLGNLPVNPWPSNAAYNYPIGAGVTRYSMLVLAQTVSSSSANILFDGGTPPNFTTWGFGATLTYQAA